MDDLEKPARTVKFIQLWRENHVYYAAFEVVDVLHAPLEEELATVA